MAREACLQRTQVLCTDAHGIGTARAVSKCMNAKQLQWFPVVTDDVALVGRRARRATINYNCAPVMPSLPRYVAPRTERTEESIAVTTPMPFTR